MEKFINTLRNVAHGEFRIPADAMLHIVASVRATASRAELNQVTSLTAIEKEVFKLFCQGMTYAEIANASAYWPLSIRNTIYRIQDKLCVNTKPEMVVRAVRSGLLGT